METKNISKVVINDTCKRRFEITDINTINALFDLLKSDSFKRTHFVGKIECEAFIDIYDNKGGKAIHMICNVGNVYFIDGHYYCSPKNIIKEILNIDINQN